MLFKANQPSIKTHFFKWNGKPCTEPIYAEFVLKITSMNPYSGPKNPEKAWGHVPCAYKIEGIVVDTLYGNIDGVADLLLPGIILGLGDEDDLGVLRCGDIIKVAVSKRNRNTYQSGNFDHIKVLNHKSGEWDIRS